MQKLHVKFPTSSKPWVSFADLMPASNGIFWDVAESAKMNHSITSKALNLPFTGTEHGLNTAPTFSSSVAECKLFKLSVPHKKKKKYYPEDDSILSFSLLSPGGTSLRSFGFRQSMWENWFSLRSFVLHNFTSCNLQLLRNLCTMKNVTKPNENITLIFCIK